MAVEKTSGSYFIQVIDRILDKGDVSPMCSDCCPCNNIYVFASVETFSKFAEAMGWDSLSTCDLWYSDCCKDDCFDKISEKYGSEVTDRILDKGIVEYSTLGTRSTLCEIYDALIANNIIYAGEAAEIVDRVLDKGIVFYCSKSSPDKEGDEQVIASVETFLKYAEVEGITKPVGTQDPPCNFAPKEVCCLSIRASVETYNIFKDIIEGGGAQPLP